MTKGIVIDTVLQQYTYNDISNTSDLTSILRSKDIGYFTIRFPDKNYYYVIWCDGTPSLQPIPHYIYKYLHVIDYKFASDSGIYIIIKYDSKTNKVLSLTKTLSELRDEFLNNVVVV